MDARPDTSWHKLVPEQHGPWEEPGWSCCGDPDCQFRSKCANIERLDAAYLAWRALAESGSPAADERRR